MGQRERTRIDVVRRPRGSCFAADNHEHGRAAGSGGRSYVCWHTNRLARRCIAFACSGARAGARAGTQARTGATSADPANYTVGWELYFHSAASDNSTRLLVRPSASPVEKRLVQLPFHVGCRSVYWWFAQERYQVTWRCLTSISIAWRGDEVTR
jgi:hypothetical protein